ncbi:retrovirus-related pol polyprotein from transposon TNT 1-94 [Tanacetum coccineum]
MWPSGVMRLTWQLETLMMHCLYCVENMVEDRIMDFGASFHATYCKEELERFKLRSGKVRLACDKNLGIAGVGDAVLKTSFGTSWTMKDVRYIPGLKRRLISVGQLDEEGYHVGFGDRQCKVTNGNLVVAHRNKRGNLYMVEDWWFGKAQESFLYNVSEDKETAETAAGVTNGIVMLKVVLETPLQFGVTERFRAERMGLRAEAPKMLWADSVIRSRDITFVDSIYGTMSVTDSSSLTKLIQKSQVVLVDILDNLAEKHSIVAEHRLSSKITQSPGRNSDTSEGSKNSGSFEDSRRLDEEDSEYRAFFEEGGSETPQVRRSTRESRAPVRYSLSANYLLMTENGEPDSYSEVLSSKESVQWKKAIIKEMVSLKMNEACSLVRLLAGKNASQSLWMFMVKEEHDGSKRYKARLVVKGFQQKRVISNCEDDYNQQGFSASWARRKPRVQIEGNSVLTDFSTEATMKDRCSEKQVLGYVLTVGVTTVEVLVFVEDSWNEEPCSDVHRVGDEREVKVLRSFNWPPSELIMEDDVLPERGYS